MLRSLTLSLAILLCCSSVFAREIRYPNVDSLGESALGYAVLKLALSKVDGDFHVALDRRNASAKRILMMLEQGQIDVVDGGFSIRTMTRFQPIYLPLDMGLTGWRLMVIHKDLASQLAKVNTLAELRTFTMGQGVSWYDADILRHAGFTVSTAPSVLSLLRMARMKRFDLLPLEAPAVYRFLDRLGEHDQQLTVDKHLVLIYPFGRFFSVRRDDTQLKQALEQGMEAALDDGSLLALLKTHPLSRDAFERADLEHRVQIRIDTPNLTEGFKAIPDKWWYRPNVH
ncbi:hypothetical protein HR45_09595 [Shewanella mangrovi]|uniref:Solute-binding protein family 3/N-terminal domain-containing protein n=1 Tax=Shewanella mangrovi TaxID=1515746 RepID=A0A094JCL7_9GAMM|nr:hypothetical protein [Shewanella mangrovi]KFZ37665.1 hypothetical protein HR45_09595 [Shewanella mangrovi]